MQLLAGSTHIGDLIMSLEKVEELGNAFERAMVISGIKQLLGRANEYAGTKKCYLDISPCSRSHGSKHGFAGISDTDKIVHATTSDEGCCWVGVMRRPDKTPICATAFIVSRDLGERIFGRDYYVLEIDNSENAPAVPPVMDSIPQPEAQPESKPQEDIKPATDEKADASEPVTAQQAAQPSQAKAAPQNNQPPKSQQNNQQQPAKK